MMITIDELFTNKEEFLKAVKKDFPEFIDDRAILDDALDQLEQAGGDTVEFSIMRNGNNYVKLYYFEREYCTDSEGEEFCRFTFY